MLLLFLYGSPKAYTAGRLTGSQAQASPGPEPGPELEPLTLARPDLRPTPAGASEKTPKLKSPKSSKPANKVKNEKYRKAPTSTGKER